VKSERKSRNTKQKELILNVLKNMKTHPTIYELYSEITKIDNTIGQATIYRNIKKFVEEQIIYVIKTRNGIDRYDYYNKHIHFECLGCNKIYDIYDNEVFNVLEKRYINDNIQILNYNITLDGYCNKCQNTLFKNNNN